MESRFYRNKYPDIIGPLQGKAKKKAKEWFRLLQPTPILALEGLEKSFAIFLYFLCNFVLKTWKNTESHHKIYFLQMLKDFWICVVAFLTHSSLGNWEVVVPDFKQHWRSRLNGCKKEIALFATAIEVANFTR